MSDRMIDFTLPTSIVDKEGREVQTLADIYDANKNAVSFFDLPIDDYRSSINDLMINQVGTQIEVDGHTEHTMLADLEKVYTNLQGNMKKAIFLHASQIKRGSRVEFSNGAVGICWSIPNDDLVSMSAILIICNTQVEVFRVSEGYNEDPNSPTFGDSIEKQLLELKTLEAFVERVDGAVRRDDVGMLHDSILRVYTFQKQAMDHPSIEIGDVFRINGKYFEVNDVNNLTSGICQIQLKNTRTVYDGWTIKQFEY